MHFKYKALNKLKWKDEEDIPWKVSKHKKADMAILISDK